MTKPLVSAIITTHNRARLVADAIASALGQEGAGREFGLETVVIDDASTDETPAVVARYPSVRYLRHPERRGLSAARNTGFAATSGSYVAFLDDDVWLPHKTRVQLALLEAHPEFGAVNSKTIVRKPDGHEYVNPPGPPPVSGWVFEALLVSNFCGGVHRFLFRRAALESAGPFDETIPCEEDYDVWLRLASHAPIAFTADPVAIYRESRHGVAATTKAAVARAEAHRRLTERALALLPDGAQSALLKRNARGWAEARILEDLPGAQDLAAARRQIIDSVGRCPWIVGYPGCARVIATIARWSAAASDAPLSETRAFTEELGAVVADRTARHRVLALAWAAVARGLRETPSGRRQAWPAAVRAARERLLALPWSASGECRRQAGRVRRLAALTMTKARPVRAEHRDRPVA
jgi:GT2 family glycosyltransferase